MNKFIGTLVLQNFLVLLLFTFIPFYLVFKRTNDVSGYDYFLLILFVAFVLIALYLDQKLLSDDNLEFGFLRFYPLIILLLKLNAMLKKHFSNLSLNLDQKILIIVYLMNKHSVLSDERYFSFSKLLNQKSEKLYDEYNEFTDTPLWIEVYEDLDEYSLDRELLASYGLKYNEKWFILGFSVIIVAYFFLILLIIVS